MAIIDLKCIPPQPVGKFTHLDLGNVWASKSFSDFSIKVGSKIFEVHRIVLGTHSSVFAAMFQNEMKEKSAGEVEIEGFSVDGVEDFLKCLYTGEIQEDNAMEIFALASKYNVQNLIENCEDIILNNIEEENALEVFNLGHLYNSESLKEAAFDEIENSFEGIELSKNLIERPEDLERLVNAKRKRENDIKETGEEMLQKRQKIEENYVKIIEGVEKQKSDAANKIDEQQAKKIDVVEKEFEKILQQFN